MTMFNADVLMNAAINNALSTSIPPMPEGEFIFTVTKLEFKNPKTDVIVLDVLCETVDPAVVEVTGINPSRGKYSAFCDLTESGLLDDSEGKNVQIGALRAALGQNEPGVPWMPAMMVGCQFRGKVAQKPDKDKPEIIRSNIVAVAPV